MQIQQRIPEQSIDSIMRDPQKYRKMMLIIQQTLYDLGYHDSAKMLEQESGINYYTDELLEVKTHLDKNDFQEAIKVIEKLEEKQQGKNNSQQVNNHNGIQPHLVHNHNHQIPPAQNNSIQQQIQQQQNPQNSHLNNISTISPQTNLSLFSLSQAKNMLYETYCMQKILEQQYDAAMKIISENIKNEATKQSLCEALVLGNHHVTKEFIQTKKQEIFKFCLSQYQQIGEKQIEKVIESYTQHEGQHNKQLKKLLPSAKKLPPMKLLTSEFQQSVKHRITHMKLNPLTKQLILIDEGKQFQQIFYLKLQQKNYEYQRQVSQTGHLSLKLKYPIFTPVFNREVMFVYKSKRQSIQSVAFNSNVQNPLVAVGSYSIIQIFDSKLDVIATVQAQNKIEKFLYLQFNPLSDLLYNCGYFEAMQVLDTTGQQIASIYPYPKTRKFLFYQSEIIGISLVTSRLYKHSIDEQVLLKDRELDQGAIPMDLAINEKQDKLAVSSLQFLYLIDAHSLQILGKTVSPTNPNKLTIELKFYGELLITLAKTFTCFQLQPDKTIESPASFLITKFKEWSGEGTFDIYDQLMVSGAKQILCWEEADMDCMMEEESEFEEEMQDGHARRDVEFQSEEEVVMMVENSEGSDEEIQMEDDDSMDQEDDDDDDQAEM